MSWPWLLILQRIVWGLVLVLHAVGNPEIFSDPSRRRPYISVDGFRHGKSLGLWKPWERGTTQSLNHLAIWKACYFFSLCWLIDSLSTVKLESVGMLLNWQVLWSHFAVMTFSGANGRYNASSLSRALSRWPFPIASAQAQVSLTCPLTPLPLLEPGCELQVSPAPSVPPIFCPWGPPAAVASGRHGQ